MNLAFLSFFNGLSNRGAETFVRELASRLSQKVRVTVYQNGKPDPRNPYQTKYLPSLYLMPDFDPLPDIIFPVNGRLQAIQTKLWSLKGKSKIIISGQSGIGIDDRLNLYTFPKVFVSLSDFQLQWAKKINPLVRHAKIPNGVDIQKFNPGVKPLDFGLAKPVVVYTAAFETIKRHNLLIDAIAKTKASLLMIGTGSLESEIFRLAESKLGKSRFKIQSLSYSQMPQVYPGCDLFVYPVAPWESFGISMLEAMASGLPVVATDDPIRREIVGNAGLLTDPIQIDKFAQSIDQALQSEWKGLPQIQAKKFSWDEISNLYLNLCNSL